MRILDTGRSANNTGPYICLFIVFQLILVAYAFPINELLTQTPLYNIDNAYHWYAVRMSQNLLTSGSSTIYDPYFNAGTAFSFLSDPSANPAKILFVSMQGALSEIQAWKVYVFLAATAGPILPGLGLRRIGFSQTVIVAGLVLSFLLWWGSWFHWFHTAGMVSYVLGCFVAFYVACQLLSWREKPQVLGGLLSGLSGALLILIHPLALIPVFILIAAYFTCNPREFRNWRYLLLLACFAVMSIGLNFWWLQDRFFPVFTSGISFPGYQATVYPLNIFLELMGVWSGKSHGAKIYPLLFLLSLIALVRSTPEQRRDLILPCFLACASLQIYAALGGLSVLLAKMTQPNRYAPAGYLLLILPAALGLASLVNDSRRLLQQKWYMKGSYLLSLLLLALCVFEFSREVSFGNHGRYGAAPPRVKPLGDYSGFVMSALKSRTDESARILFEISKGRIHDGGHLAGYYAYQTDREFIGGPYPSRYFASFWDGFVFGRPIQEWSRHEFLDYLDLYNIGWILVHSDESKDFFKSIDQISLLDSHRELRLYLVDRPHSFFLKGSGRVVNRGPNLIQLAELEGSEIIIKYHYINGLISQPATEIESVFLNEDPVPFIKIRNPPRELTLVLKH